MYGGVSEAIVGSGTSAGASAEVGSAVDAGREASGSGRCMRRRLAHQQQRQRAARVHLGVGQEPEFLELLGRQQVRLVDLCGGRHKWT